MRMTITYIYIYIFFLMLTHPSYMALQYPLLFPYGEDWFHDNIPYHDNTGKRKTTRGFVTMKEYYAYMIQQRNNQGTTLIKGGRLYQQYIVDAYMAGPGYGQRGRRPRASSN